MALGQWIRDRLNGVRRVRDPVFGELECERNGVWTCTLEVPALGRHLPVWVTTVVDGPTEPQRAMWHAIERRFQELHAKAIDFASAKRAGKPGATSLTLRAVILHQAPPEKGDFVFLVGDAKDRTWDVIFEGWEPDRIERVQL